jgi:phage repressor protein C with HTH and peptisase S24 domain
VIKYHNINVNWLNDGLGDMFAGSATTEKSISGKEEINDGVPFFSINLSDIRFSEFNLLQETPEYYVNFKPFNDCDAYLPVYGDSMYPKYASGEIIVVREITNQDIIQWGEAYLVVTDDSANNMITVKLLFEHNHESKIVMRASNPNYKGDTILERQAIKKLFIVKGKIMRNQL